MKRTGEPTSKNVKLLKWRSLCKELSFEFAEPKILIEEKACEDVYGVRCRFSNKYQKKN